MRRRSSSPASAAAACCRSLLQLFAFRAQPVDLRSQLDQCCLGGRAFAFNLGCHLLPVGDEVGLLVARVAIAIGREHPLLQATLDACRLRLHLAQGRTGVCCLTLGLAAVVGFGLDGRALGGDLALQLSRAQVGLGKLSLHGLELLQHLAQLALQRQRAAGVADVRP